MVFHLYTKENNHFLIPEWFQGTVLPWAHDEMMGTKLTATFQYKHYEARIVTWWPFSDGVLCATRNYRKLLAQCPAHNSNSSINASSYFFLNYHLVLS